MAINEAAKDWGLKCLRYEISMSASLLIFPSLENVSDFILLNMSAILLFSGDISPPRGVRAAMEMQAEAERKKRAQVLESEGN